MKKLLNLAFAGLIGISTAFSQALGLTNDFASNSAAGWGSYASYMTSAANQELQVVTNKHSWDGFNYSFGQTLNISANPYASIKVKTTRDMNMTMYIRDINNNYSASKIVNNEVIASGLYTEVSFNFAAVTGVDFTKIKEIQIDINGGTDFAGTFYLDDFKIGNVALKSATMTNIANQGTSLNAGQSTINFRGVTDGTTGTNAISISATSSNTALIPNPTIVYTSPSTSGQLKFTPVANATGTATISVNVTAPNTNATKVVKFDVLVEGNLAPKITQVANQIAKVGQSTTINLAGINDGNPNAKQTLSISASSSNTGIIPNPSVSYTSDNENASVTFTPQSAGTANITVTVTDNAGTANGGVNQKTMTFAVNSYAQLNSVPLVAKIDNQYLLKNSSQQTIVVTGLDDGDASVSQNLTLSLSSPNTTLVSAPVINYTQGQSTATITYTPIANRIGTATFTLSVTDNGGNANNNGNQTTTTTFDVQVREIPITAFVDDFNDGVVGAGWGNGEGVHDVTESGGIMQIHVDKSRTGNVWAGEWYGIPNELDLTQYPYISITMKVSNAPKEMLIFLWDAYDRYNTGGTVSKIVSGSFVEYYFDFSGKNKDGSGNIVDFSRIKALLFNFEPGRMYTGDFFFEDIRIGSQAHRDPASIVPKVSFNPIGDVTPLKNSGVQNVVISGLTNGSGGTTGISLNASSSNTSLVPNPSLTSVGSDGRATLSFTPVAGQTGQAKIYVSAAYSGATTKYDTLSVDVIDLTVNAGSNVAVSVNTSSTYQSIDGFGAFYSWADDIELAVKSTNDLGVSMVRFGMIDEGFEPVNDNSNPNIINPDAFNYNAINFELIKQLSQRTSIQKYILTMWSAPAWMKENKNISSSNGYLQNNRVMPEYYEEYAEHMVAIIKAIKARTGVELYAISLQNEPQFNEPYASALVNPQEMRDMIKIVGPRMQAEGLSTKIYAAEALPAQGSLKAYLDAVYNDPAANPYQQIAALHNYDADGINVGGAGATQWSDFYSWASRTPYPKVTWMTETSGHPNTWNGSVELAGNIYNALKFGKISAWVYWSMFVGAGSAEFGLVVDKVPDIKYYASKNFYKYVRPGAVMVDATSPDANVLALAFKHTADNTFTSILINKSSVAKVVQLSGASIPTTLAAYTTSASKSFEQSAVSNGLVILPPSSIVTVYGSYSAVVDNQAPSVPANLASPSKTATSVDLTWTASTDNVGVTAYEVYRGGTLVGTTSNTNYTVGSLSANTAYSFTVKAKDAAGNTSAASTALSVTTNASTGTANGDGKLVYEYWSGIAGTNLSAVNFTTTPSGTQNITLLEGPANWADNYGSRIRGYVIPSTSGSYTFYIATDDDGEFYLSTNELPANKALAANITGWAGSRDWTKYASQQSAAKSLVAGQKYYFEVLQKEGGGGDNVAIGWTGPGISTISVPTGANISSYTVTGTDISAPSIPNGLVASAITQTSFTLSWTASTDNVGVIGYDVYRNGTLIGSPTSSSFNVTGLSAATAYSMTVRAKDAAGNFSAQSSSLSVTTSAATTGGPSGYTFCSNEGQTCAFTGLQDVAYGSNGSFNYLTNQTGYVACNNGVFGDPISGITKACYTKPSSTVGTGLTGEYFTNTGLTAPSALTRIDATVNFDWANGSPASGTIGTDNFSVRWTGQVLAPVSGNYIFSTTSDDGVRLSINNVQVINNWTLHGSTTDNSAAIALTANQKYNVNMEFYEATGGAVAKLLWAYPGQTQQAIPVTYLYPTTGFRLGADEITSDFEMYPNPAKESVNIQLSNQFEGNVVVTISDVTGVTVAIEQFNHSGSGIHTISTSSLASGVYFVIVNSAANKKITRLLIY